MYVLLKLLASGSFPTGVSADWRSQFSAATIVNALPLQGGAIAFPGVQTTYGVYAAFAFYNGNPFDAQLCVAEASAGAPVQVYLNGTLVTEKTTPGTLTLSPTGGYNLVEFVRAQSPLVLIPAGPLIDPQMRSSRWVSLYPTGADPFLSRTATDNPFQGATALIAH